MAFQLDTKIFIIFVKINHIITYPKDYLHISVSSLLLNMGEWYKVTGNGSDLLYGHEKHVLLIRMQQFLYARLHFIYQQFVALIVSVGVYYELTVSLFIFLVFFIGKYFKIYLIVKILYKDII